MLTDSVVDFRCSKIAVGVKVLTDACTIWESIMSFVFMYMHWHNTPVSVG